MDYFYGGKRGFSFILRPNKAEGSKGYWHSLEEIIDGIQRGWIKYGEYALITENTVIDDEENFQYTDNHGKIYRIDRGNIPILVGRIGNPAPLYELILTTNDIDAYHVNFDFLDDNESKTAQGITGYWKMTTEAWPPPGEGTEEDPSIERQRIGIGVKVPKPVIEFKNISSNNFDEAVKAGIKFDEETYEQDQDNGPMYFPFKNTLSPNIYIGTFKERTEKDNLFNVGDLWLRVFDPDEDSVVGDQTTISLKRKKVMDALASRFYFYEDYSRVSHGSSYIYQATYHNIDDEFSDARSNEIKAFNPFDDLEMPFHNNLTIIFKESFDEADLKENDSDAGIVKYIDSAKNYISVSASFYTGIIGSAGGKQLLDARRANYLSHWSAIYAPVINNTVNYNILLVMNGEIGNIEQKTNIKFNQYNVEYYQNNANQTAPFELKNIKSCEPLGGEATYPRENIPIRLCALVLYSRGLDPTSVAAQQTAFSTSGSNLIDLHGYCYDIDADNTIGKIYDNTNKSGTWINSSILNSLNITYL